MGQQTATESDTYMSKAKDKPVHQIRRGSVKAAIWANETDNGIKYNVTFSRLYKDKESGSWRSSESFGGGVDCLLLAKTAEAAFNWVAERADEKETDGQD